MTGPRVVLLHYTFPSLLGGVEMVLARHARALRDAGARVTLAAGRGRLTVPGVRAERIPELDSRHPAVERAFTALARGEVPAALPALRRRIASRLRPLLRGADRVVVHNILTLHKNAPAALALHDLARSLPPGRLVVWVHDLAWTDARYLRQRHAGEPWDVFARAVPGARYVAVSEARRDETAAILGIPAASIEVVPDGVDTAPLLRLSPATRALVADLGLDDGEALLLLPARLTRRKRVEVAIDAAGELRRRGRKVRLVVTGAPGPHNVENLRYLDELRERARATDGAAVLLFDRERRPLPYRVVADLYALADALVFPSEHEGFGIPLVEAAIARTAIVCSDIPPHRAIAGDDATYVPPDGDATALADAVEKALGTDRAARLRARARERYSWDAILRERVVPLILNEDMRGATPTDPADRGAVRRTGTRRGRGEGLRPARPDLLGPRAEERVSASLGAEPK